MGRPAFSPVALSRESCTSIFQPADCWQPLQIMLAQMRRSFLARRLPNKTYALFNGPWNIFQPDGAIPLQKRIPRHHGITPRTQIASAMCEAPRLDSRGPSGTFGETRRSMSSFAKASKNTRCAFLHGLTAVAYTPLHPEYILTTYSSRENPWATHPPQKTGEFFNFFRQECQRPISFSKHIEIRNTSFSLRTRQAGA